MTRRCVFELGYNCNLSCKTCNIWKKEFSEQRLTSAPLTKQDLFNIQKRLAQAGIQQITFVGGEPLLFPGIFEHIQNSCDLGMRSAIVTNGTLLTPRMSHKLVEAGLHTLIVSIDGPDQIHDNIRGNHGVLSRVVENILYLGRQKKKEGWKIPKIKIYSTISRLNQTSIPSLLSIAQRLDVNAIRFQLISVVSPAIRDTTNQIFSSEVVRLHSYAVCPDLKPQPAELAKISQTLTTSASWAQKTGIKLQIETILTENPRANSCAFIDQSMVITPEGNILNCPMLTNLSIGNLREQSLSRIWGNPLHQGFLNQFRKKNYLPICQECCVEKLTP